MSYLSIYLSYHPPGNADRAMRSAAHVSTGRVGAGGQYHFYMEAQSAVASIEDGQCITVVCGTQNPASYQSNIASLLGIPNNKVHTESFIMSYLISYLNQSIL